MNKTFQLNEFNVELFLKNDWQKKPLLIRNAVKNVEDFLNKEQLFEFSRFEDIESRLVTCKKDTWHLAHGPFSKVRLKKLSGEWSLLIQDVNHLSAEGNALLNLFNFIPYARLDDLMVSVASDKGGVGPHVDSYDVFLIQGSGKRLWKISDQTELIFDEKAPLKILTNFKATDEWILEPGDMLYLPPNIAHHGIAIGESITYSIGFRTPDSSELVNEFLLYGANPILHEGRYADPALEIATSPAEIPQAMCKYFENIIKNLTWPNAAFEVCLGKYLTMPKSKVEFEEVVDISLNDFKKISKGKSIELDFQTQLLYTTHYFFINGEDYLFKTILKKEIQQLANTKKLQIRQKFSASLWRLLHLWYIQGYIDIT